MPPNPAANPPTPRPAGCATRPLPTAGCSAPPPAGPALTRHPGYDLKLLGAESQLPHVLLSHKVLPAAAVVAAGGHRQAAHAAPSGRPRPALPPLPLQLAGAAAQREVGGCAAQVLAKGHPGRCPALQARHLQNQGGWGGMQVMAGGPGCA